MKTETCTICNKELSERSMRRRKNSPQTVHQKQFLGVPSKWLWSSTVIELEKHMSENHRVQTPMLSFVAKIFLWVTHIILSTWIKFMA